MKLLRPLMLSACALLLGCAHETSLPTYDVHTTADALQILRARADGIHTISAQGTIILTRPSGDSIHLDAALVARSPKYLHLRAWKFNQTVFDLTLTPHGLWMLNPDKPELRQKMQSGKFGTVQFARAWSLLTHDFFFTPS
ncbi:MAG TPA: hypothetical protein VG722_07860, partial [Tepidisphaeraceae bacterium]|nr:hypothetical protein [Tepidisphaeraceae bacterium]